MKLLLAVLLIVVPCVFAKTWSSYTSLELMDSVPTIMVQNDTIIMSAPVIYLGFGNDSIEIMKIEDKVECGYFKYRIAYRLGDDLESSITDYIFEYYKPSNVVEKDSVLFFTRWTTPGPKDYVSVDSLMSYQININDFEYRDFKENEAFFYFNHNHFDCIVDTLTIKLYKIPLHDYVDTLINVVSDVSLFLYKKAGAYDAACYVFSLDNYAHISLSCQYQDDGTLNFDEMIPIKREDILKVYEKSLNPDRNSNKIKAGRMKSKTLNKSASTSFLINGVRRKSNSSKVIIKNQTPMLQLR